jgi:hypothetical protein
MKIEKKILDNIVRCYCVSNVTIDNELFIFMASEEVGGPCYAYHGPDFEKKEAVWEQGGGTMSIIEIPDTNGEFLAVQNFFPGFKSEKAKIVWCRRDPDKGWIIQDVLNLPYVHRFDIIKSGSTKWFIGATLCTSKKDREDWSDPGKVYVGILPDDLSQGIKVWPIMDNLLKNHGYCRGTYEGKDACYITCECGIYAFIPPADTNGDWSIHHILERPISDVAVFDIDGCGTDELITIEPFHGSKFIINKKYGNEYRQVYTYPNEINFAHAVWAGLIRGVPTVIGGIRRMNCELFMVQCSDAEKQIYNTTIIEEGVGPSNVAVINQADRDIILSANHTKNEAAIYVVTD